jgi:hypothetical protein
MVDRQMARQHWQPPCAVEGVQHDFFDVQRRDGTPRARVLPKAAVSSLPISAIAARMVWIKCREIAISISLPISMLMLFTIYFQKIMKYSCLYPYS